MSEEYKITRTESLPAGWYWKEWDDGSGCLIAPDSARYYSYDLAPYSAQGGIEYQKESGGPSCPYGVFWGSLEEFKEYGENQMKHTMSQELIDRLRSEAETFEPGSFAQNMLLEAADTIQYLLDGADEVNQALREQIEENERLKADIKRKDESLDYARTIMAENERLKAENERLSRPTLSQLRRERIQLMGENEKLKAENARLTADIGILMNAVKWDCTYCKHNGEWINQSPCWHCAGYAAREFVTGNYWEWMGG